VTLDELPKATSALIIRVGGERAFRRRLLELGFLPGTGVEFLRVAPLGDPLEFCVRGCHLSIRRAEARQVEVEVSGDGSAEGPQ